MKLILFFLLGVFIFSQLPLSAREIFMYGADKSFHRYYYYKSHEGEQLQYLLDDYDVRPKKYAFLTQYPHIFEGDIRVLESENIVIIQKLDQQLIVFDKKTGKLISQYFFYKRGNDFRLRLQSNAVKSLKNITPQIVESSYTHQNITYFEREIGNGITLLKKSKHYKFTGTGLVSEQVVVGSEVRLSPPDRTRYVFEGIFNGEALELHVMHSGKKYCFLNQSGKYQEITGYYQEYVKSSGQQYVIRGDTRIAVATSDLKERSAYYFIKDEHTEHVREINDFKIISFLFRKTPAVSIRSHAIKEAGYANIFNAVKFREKLGLALYSGAHLDMRYYTLGFWPVKRSPFPHPERKKGYVFPDTYYPYDPHYSDRRVGIFIPYDIDFSKNYSFLIFLHGSGTSQERVIAAESLCRDIYHSQKQIILVVPQLAKHAQDSFGGRFEDPRGFDYFLYDVKKLLEKINKWDIKQLDRASVIVAAHNGGYKALSNILIKNKQTIKQVYLFDGLYWHRDRFVYWKLKNPDSKLVILYTNNGGTQSEVGALKDTLYSSFINQEAIAIQLNADEMDLKKAAVSPIKNHNIVFIGVGAVSQPDIVSAGYFDLLIRNLIP